MENQHNQDQDLNNKENISNKSTTGSGFSEAERNMQDSVNSQKDDKESDGTQTLVDSYNINDKANSDSSPEDFFKTTSNFHHAEKPEDDPGNDSIH